MCSKHFLDELNYCVSSPYIVFYLWIIQMYPRFIHCHKLSQEICCVPTKVLKNVLRTHNTVTLLICIQLVWRQFGRDLPQVYNIMDDEPYAYPKYLQSLCYPFS
jgi:hypothetical protein